MGRAETPDDALLRRENPLPRHLDVVVVVGVEDVEVEDRLPGTSERDSATHIVMRSDRVRSCTATIEFCGGPPGLRTIQATWNDATTMSTTSRAKKYAARTGLSRRENWIAGR
jgi:hypothetical protein